MGGLGIFVLCTHDIMKFGDDWNFNGRPDILAVCVRAGMCYHVRYLGRQVPLCLILYQDLSRATEKGCVPILSTCKVQCSLFELYMYMALEVFTLGTLFLSYATMRILNMNLGTLC